MRTWLLAFTALFAVAAGFVFWGAWSPDAVPVMPDCATRFPSAWIADFFAHWRGSGKFVPGDLAALAVPPYLLVEFQYAVAAYCSALALAYFLRGRGVGRFASFSAGILLAFSGYWFTLFSAGHLGWFRWMTYGVFAFGLADRAISGGGMRHWILLGATLAWGSFYQPDMWLLFTVFTVAYALFRTLSVRPSPARLARGAAVSAAVFFAVGIPSFRSAIVNDIAVREGQIAEGQTVDPASASDDAEKRWIFATNWSMPPEDTLEFAVPRIHGDTSCPMTLAIGNARNSGVRPYTGRLGRPYGADEGNYRQHSLYVGFATCAFAAFAVILAFRRRRDGADASVPSLASDRATLIFFAASALIFWILSMGRYCAPAYRIVFALPAGDMLRAPVKWHHLTEFCIAVLAGYGIDAAVRLARRRGNLAVAAVVAVVAVGVADLVRVDSLYMAPYPADTTLATIPQPVPEAPRERAAFYSAVRSRGFIPVGVARTPFSMPDGSVREFDAAVVARRVPRPEAAGPGDVAPLPPLQFAFAILSAASTLAVLAFAVLPCAARRLGFTRRRCA